MQVSVVCMPLIPSLLHFPSCLFRRLFLSISIVTCLSLLQTTRTFTWLSRTKQIFSSVIERFFFLKTTHCPLPLVSSFSCRQRYLLRRKKFFLCLTKLLRATDERGNKNFLLPNASKNSKRCREAKYGDVVDQQTRKLRSLLRLCFWMRKESSETTSPSRSELYSWTFLLSITVCEGRRETVLRQSQTFWYFSLIDLSSFDFAF
jgi:hypothetical protein